VTGLAANLLGLSMPTVLEPTANRIGAAALGLGLLTAGAGLQPGRLRGDKVLSVALLSIRHFWLPVLAWLLARLIGLDPAQTTTLLIFSALPTASSCYVLAVRMGYDGGYTAALVTLSTLLGLASLPFALGVLRNM
jgi:predicted permease